MSDSPYLTVAEVASYLNLRKRNGALNPKAVYAIKALRKTKLDGVGVRIHKDDLAAYEAGARRSALLRTAA